MPTQFFRVDGADQETGQETYLVLRAKTRPQAEKLARDQGLLIASVRVASPEDWAATAEGIAEHSEETVPHEASPEEDPHAPVHAHAEPVPHTEEHHETGHEHFIEPAPAADPIGYAAESPRLMARRSHVAPAPSSAGAVVLACAGAAFIIGGVLAMVLGLLPDNSVQRNDLQQLDFRLHSLVQTTLGGMLVVSGLLVCVIAAMCYLLPRRTE